MKREDYMESRAGKIILPIATATKHDAAKPRYSLLPHMALEQMVAVMEFGAQKYGDNNWRSGMKWSRCFDAAMRHLWAWFRGEERDADSGINHLAHAAVNLLFIIEWRETGKGEDDRPYKGE